MLSSYMNFQASFGLTLMITLVTRKFIICLNNNLTGFQRRCRNSIQCLTGFQCLFQNSVHIRCYRIITVSFLSRNFLLSFLLIFEPGFTTSSVTSSGRRSAPSTPSRVLVMALALAMQSQMFHSPILIRHPEQTNHTQNDQQVGKVELGLQLQLFPAYIY